MPDYYNLVLRTLDTSGHVMDSFEVQTRRRKRRSGEVHFCLIGRSIKRTVVSTGRLCFSHVEIVIPMLDELGVRPKLSTSLSGLPLVKGESITFTVPRIVLVIR